MAFDVGSSGGRGKRHRARPDMNVTPLVDVVLVLLIIFMVITPMLAKQFWVHLPTEPATAPPTDATPPIVVTVDADGVVRVNREAVPLDALEGRLRRALAARADRTAVFDADDDAPYGTAVAALDLMRGGGASTIVVSAQAL